MAATIENIPGTLNITLKRADDFSTSLDFDTEAVGVTATSTIVSTVTGLAIATISTSVLDAATGSIRLSLTQTQTAGLAPGTYQWRHVWDYPGENQRTMLAGFLEVLP